MIKVKDKKYKSIKEVLDTLDKDNKDRVIIDLNGEKIFDQITIDKPNITLVNGTIEYNLGAKEVLADSYIRGTFRTYTLFIDADNVRLENVSVINSVGYKNGQAIALMVDGDNFIAKDSKISSYQDTLFIAPLPPYEYEERGFVGPLKDRGRIYRKSYFDNCLIEGSIDFIFGGGFGYFYNCEIKSLNIHQDINGYVTAPSTPEDKEYGFIFDKCKFTSEDNMKASVYLSRPWRNYGKCFITNSVIGSHIRKEGYHDWNKLEARSTTEFKEYRNIPDDINLRVDWIKEVNDNDLKYINKLRKELGYGRDL